MVTPIKVAVLLIQELCTVCIAPQLLLSKQLCRSGLGWLAALVVCAPCSLKLTPPCNRLYQIWLAGSSLKSRLTLLRKLSSAVQQEGTASSWEVRLSTHVELQGRLPRDNAQYIINSLTSVVLQGQLGVQI